MKIKFSKIPSYIIFFLIAIEVINNSIATIVLPLSGTLLQVLMYGSMLLISIFFLKGIRIEFRLLLVVIVAAMSLIVNNVEAKYNAPFRLISWTLLIATVGPLIYNPMLLRLRSKMLDRLFFTFMWIGGISFLYWLSGVPSIGRGHFSGLMNHSMVLAPVASLGGIYAFYRFMDEDKRMKKVFFLVLFIFNALDVLLAASRTAFIAFSLGFLILLFFSKFRFKKLIIALLFVLTIGLSSKMDDNGIDDSVAGEMISRGMENTREALWNDRILEFKSSPIIGVGFATQNDSISGKEGKEGGRFGGKVEPGSTYLMVLSMTGALGAISLIFFISRAFLNRKFWKRISSKEQYKLASYTFFAVHFVAEGYIYSSGALLAFVFWLLVGATYPYKGINYKQVLGTE